MFSNDPRCIQKLSQAGNSGCLACLLIVCIGCGSGAPPRASVSGRVSVDGVPVEDGSISFVPTNGNTGPTAGGSIVNGRYSIAAAKGPAPGWNLVVISGSKKTGKKVPSGVVPQAIVDEIVSVVPERYHTDSTLNRELRPGVNTVDFELTAK